MKQIYDQMADGYRDVNDQDIDLLNAMNKLIGDTIMNIRAHINPSEVVKLFMEGITEMRNEVYGEKNA